MLGLRFASGFDVLQVPTTLRALTNVFSNGPIRVVSFATFAVVVAYWWPTLMRAFDGMRPIQFLALLGQHGLAVFAWSIFATYFSAYFMPEHPTRLWCLLDVTLTVSSLAIPAAVYALWTTRLKSARPGMSGQT